MVLPKICGGDIELANFILSEGKTSPTPGSEESYRMSGEAAFRLLAEIEGFPKRQHAWAWWEDEIPRRSPPNSRAARPSREIPQPIHGDDREPGPPNDHQPAIPRTNQSKEEEPLICSWPAREPYELGTTPARAEQEAEHGMSGIVLSADAISHAGQTPRPVTPEFSHGSRSPAERSIYGGSYPQVYSAYGGSYSYYQSSGSYANTPGRVDPQDWGRKFLASNGGCVYIDLNHLEICLPEVISARDHLAAWLAMLEIVHQAYSQANQKLRSSEKLQVLVNNSDGFGNSYGSHLNMLVTRDCLHQLFHRRVDHLLYLITYLTSSIIFTGQGKVGSENGTPAVNYQLSQRADFFEQLLGSQTTFHRPLINTRDESHCESVEFRKSSEEARLHLIFFDSNLCHVAHLLKVGVTQLFLAALEQDCLQQPDLLLRDPLQALVAWSHDPSLKAEATLLSGKRATAIEVQLRLCDELERFVSAGKANDVVPEAQWILKLWSDVLRDLHQGDLAKLAPQLDWVLKKMLLEQTLQQNPHLTWQSPELKCLDHLYSSIDKNEGLFWLMLQMGCVERLVSESEVELLRREPPPQTRAYLRAHLLRKAGECVEDLDWSWIRLRRHPLSKTFALPSPHSCTAKEYAPIVQNSQTLDELLVALQPLERKLYSREPMSRPYHGSYGTDFGDYANGFQTAGPENRPKKSKKTK